MSLDEWIAATLAGDGHARVRAVLPVVDALYDDWAAVWEDAEAVAVTDDARRALRAWLDDAACVPDDVERCSALAASVGESLHTIEGAPGAGSAMVVPALLAAALGVAAGAEEALALDEVLHALPDMVAIAPELEAQLIRVIGAP